MPIERVADSPTPAEQLAGKDLPNGWKVESLVDRPENATGGHFSTSYVVRSEQGEAAFLKAMDYRRALESPDPAKTLQVMTAAFNFERTLLEKCWTNRLSRIVRVVDSGTVPAKDGDHSSVVQYLIFELARGDVRLFADFGALFDNAWVLRTIHGASAALRQLHGVQIAHQDLKPSNILVFDKERSKLADLGRAFDLHSTSPFDNYACAGDLTYAPPELLYGYTHADWRVRRIACDLYLLGSLVVFLYMGVSVSHLVFPRLDKKHHYDQWGGDYGEVLPYLQQVFSQVFRELRQQIPAEFVDELVEAVTQLCDPDPHQRGHPKSIRPGSRQYSLERFVSKFDLLARRAELSTNRVLSRNR